jgi:enoyl-CoA hydratase/carnithine racemase
MCADRKDSERVEMFPLDGGVLEVRMYGPTGNPIDLELIRALSGCLASLAVDRTCRAVLLTSADRHFSVGATGKISSSATSAEWSVSDLYEEATALFLFPKPVVALIRGAAIGGGLGLAMIADFRHADTTARFAANFTRLGYHPGFGLTATLPRVIGRQAALDLLISGRRIDANEAVQIGLCDSMHDPAEAKRAAHEFAALLAAAAPLAACAVKATLNGDFADVLLRALAHELSEQTRLKQTADYAEGTAAALERREPRFSGT